MKYKVFDKEHEEWEDADIFVTQNGDIYRPGFNGGLHCSPSYYQVYTSTGLFCCHLNEIWEGSLVIDNVGEGVVEYSDKYAGFRINYGDGYCKWFYDYLDSERKSLEVIGHITGVIPD